MKDELTNIVIQLYLYCTDFTINLANLTNTSYYEVNFFFFCVLYPFLLIVLPITAMYLKLKLRELKQQIKAWLVWLGATAFRKTNSINLFILQLLSNQSNPIQKMKNKIHFHSLKDILRLEPVINFNLLSCID